MISDLRETFIANLDNLDWMDSRTKKYAKEKVAASNIFIFISVYLIGRILQVYTNATIRLAELLVYYQLL